MTRMYLSPTATVFTKIGLLLIQLIIGLFNLITLPIRKISLKAYGAMFAIAGVVYPVLYQVDLRTYAAVCAICAVIFAVSLIAVNVLYKILNSKVNPKVARMFNSPLSIRLNRFYC